MLYNVLNLMGLALGFAAFLLVIFYIVYETSFEKFHSKAERIYRLTVHYTSNSGYDTHFARVDSDWTKTIPDELPEVSHLIRFQNHEPKFVRIGDEKFAPEHAYSVDAAVFEVFDFKLLKGDPKSALVQPFSVVITESMAHKYFGEEDAFGRELIITRYYNTDEEAYKIMGIMEDLLSHTHMPVDMMFSFRNEEERSGWAYTYLMTDNGADINSLTKKIESLLVKNEGEKSLEGTEYVLQALPDIHLHSDLARELQPNGNIMYVKVFLWVAVFILLIAMINFMNLNSVISLGRAKEIGIRKVMGSGHKQLLVYSLVESTFLSIAAAIFASALVLSFPIIKMPLGWKYYYQSVL